MKYSTHAEGGVTLRDLFSSYFVLIVFFMVLVLN